MRTGLVWVSEDTRKGAGLPVWCVVFQIGGNEAIDALNCGIDAAVGLKLQPAVARRHAIKSKTFTAGPELDTA